MAKKALCIGIFCVATIILFVYMCMLMTGVDPPPLKYDEDDLEDITDQVDTTLFNEKIDNINEPDRFGIEKVMAYSKLLKINNTDRPVPNFVKEEHNDIDFLLSRRPVIAIKIKDEDARMHTIKATTDKVKDTVLLQNTMNSPPYQIEKLKAHRRSAEIYSDITNDFDSQPVIFRIIGKNGQPSIEIKIILPNDFKNTKDQYLMNNTRNNIPKTINLTENYILKIITDTNNNDTLKINDENKLFENNTRDVDINILKKEIGNYLIKLTTNSLMTTPKGNENITYVHNDKIKHNSSALQQVLIENKANASNINETIKIKA